MWEVFISSVISAISAIIVCIISNNAQNEKRAQEHQATINLVTYRLEQLEKKQDLHNTAVSRLYEVERKLGIDEEKIKVANHRIEDLEEMAK